MSPGRRRRSEPEQLTLEGGVADDAQGDTADARPPSSVQLDLVTGEHQAPAQLADRSLRPAELRIAQWSDQGSDEADTHSRAKSPPRRAAVANPAHPPLRRPVRQASHDINGASGAVARDREQRPMCTTPVHTPVRIDRL
jgi:hypothetical protein